MNSLRGTELQLQSLISAKKVEIIMAATSLQEFMFYFWAVGSVKKDTPV